MKAVLKSLPSDRSGHQKSSLLILAFFSLKTQAGSIVEIENNNKKKIKRKF